VRVHCGIYKGSYNVSNISYLNSPPPVLSFLPPSSSSWNSFNRHHFCIYMDVYTFFTPNSPSYPLSLLPPHLPQVPTPPTPGRLCSAFLFSDFVEEKKITFLFVWDKGSFTGTFLMIFLCITPIGLSPLTFELQLFGYSIARVLWWETQLISHWLLFLVV
jgi:hypothetical protein